MSNYKQSSVDFLINLLTEKGYAGVLSEDEVEQARAMHETEHFNTWWHEISENEPISFKQYYNETFGGNYEQQ